MFRKNITVVELAKAVKKSTVTVSFWKNGHSEPGWKELSKISAVFGVDYKIFLS
jgi:hypothetical protein